MLQILKLSECEIIMKYWSQFLMQIVIKQYWFG